jgi:hypothetical protein
MVLLDLFIVKKVKKLERLRRKLEVGSRKLEVGRPKLEVGSWKTEVGSWKLEESFQWQSQLVVFLLEACS